jgi:hypothetical protein
MQGRQGRPRRHPHCSPWPPGYARPIIAGPNRWPTELAPLIERLATENEGWGILADEYVTVEHARSPARSCPARAGRREALDDGQVEHSPGPRRLGTDLGQVKLAAGIDCQHVIGREGRAPAVRVTVTLLTVAGHRAETRQEGPAHDVRPLGRSLLPVRVAPEQADLLPQGRRSVQDSTPSASEVDRVFATPGHIAPPVAAYNRTSRRNAKRPRPACIGWSGAL